MRFRHSVRVYRHTFATDDDGQPFTSTLVRKNVPCNIQPTGGRESEIGRQNVPITDYTVSLYQAAKKPITEDCWLIWRGRRLQVANVPPSVNENLPVDLLCTEEVGKA